MKKGLRRGVAGVLLGATLLGTTSFAYSGNFSFEVAPGQGERGTGKWVERTRSQKYADIDLNSFSGVGVNLYVKDYNYNRVSDIANVTGTGQKSVYYRSSVIENADYQLFAAPSYSNSYRVTVAQGTWQP